MKPYVYAYILSAIWILLVIIYMPYSNWYGMIASKTWSFVVVNTILFIPVLSFLVIADRCCPSIKESEAQQKSSDQ
ncbi:hypothetical protein SAMN03159341_102390 [Paenibacillus sp. 1_12]|uniref:hypothetical protein n=1 Tax=Paenibacillus sp. 1_12 TaxID=1566278 RepID=UPI0008EB9723|nr:hypothetical protein [Paenibacillus sp. 1_12]SFK95943.1 hypothetical protein SAMN03159341_102390 [Paenibacillus sp. 1_12]